MLDYLFSLLLTHVLPFVAMHAPKALGTVAAWAARALVTEAVRGQFQSRAELKAYRAAIARTLERCGQEYPHLVRFFLSRATLPAIDTELRLFLTRDRVASAEGIIAAYEHHVQRATHRNLRQVAQRFLVVLQEECKKERALQTLLSHRQTDETNRILHRIEEHLTQQGDLASPRAPQSSGLQAIEVAGLRESLQAASRDLLDWPQTLDDARWIDRPELAVLIERISSAESSISLLLGDPGAGKSALLARLGSECVAQQWAVFAIKADQLAEEVATLEGLREFFDLPAGILVCLRHVATTTKTVVLVDQLDALSELVDLRTRRLTVLLRLINEIKRIENIHIVCSCRTFERQYDRRLNTIEAEDVPLALPAWEVTAQLLEQRGIGAAAWPEAFRELLRVPQHLKLFLRHFSGAGEARIFETYQIMLERLWTERLFAGQEAQRARVLLERIATEMAENEVLFVASPHYDGQREQVEYLCANGVLQYDHTRRQISFTHQTLFDFACARAFVRGDQSLRRYVLERQTGLFIRPKLWSALHYLRGTDVRAYQNEITAIWSDHSLRAHLRMLLIDFLGQQEEPLAFEVQLLRPMFRDTTFAAKAFGAICGRYAWFNEVADRELIEIMRGAPQLAWPAQAVLATAWPFARERVLELIDAFWVSDTAKHTHAWYTLRALSVWGADSLAVAMRLVEEGAAATAHVQDLASIVSAANPVLAPTLIAAHLRRLMRDARAARPARCGADAGEAALERLRYESRDPVRQIADASSTEWYDVTAIAEAAPRCYLEQVWPSVREILEEISADDTSRAHEYRSDHLLSTRLEVDGKERGREYPLMDSFVFAVRLCARQDRQYFRQFVQENESSDAMTVHRLLALGLIELAADDPSFALEYLLQDERRLSLENFHESERESKQLIRALVPHLTPEACMRLEAAILRADPYRAAAAQMEPAERMRFQKYAREFRLRLLLQIPSERLTALTRERIQSELRLFPDFRDERRDVRIISSSSPMSATRMAEAADSTIVSFLEAFPDETEWGTRFNRGGGSIQVARAFAEFAKQNPARAIAVIETMNPASLERPAAYAIREFEEQQLSDAALLDLVLKLDRRGFRGSEFREYVADAVKRRVKTAIGLPDAIVSLLERWLDEITVVQEAADEEINHEASKDDPDEARAERRSILWGYGGVRTLPSGAYPILSAYAYGLFARESVPSTRLLATLNTFLNRSDQLSTWDALCFDALTNLSRCDQAEAQRFLTRLFDLYPRLLARDAGVVLIAYTLSWADPDLTRKRMLMLCASDWSLAHNAYGELLVLRAILVKNDPWARAQIERLLVSPVSGTEEDADVLSGLMHGAAHLWRDADDRALLSRLLSYGMSSTSRAVSQAAMDWFRLIDELKLTDDTRPIIEALATHSSHDSAHSETFVLDRLGDIVDEAPDLVYQIAHRLIEKRKSNLANFATAAPLDSEALLSIALTLQRLREPHRAHGMQLFELLLHYNAYKVHDVLMDIDRRPGSSTPARTISRRRRRKAK